MDRNDVQWAGYWSALVTPFTEEGKLDEEAFARVTDITVSQGAHGILVNGSTGEWVSQSIEERKRLAEIAVEVAAGRAPVAVNVTAPTTQVAVRLARHAASAGAESVMAAVPVGARPTAREAENYFKEIFASTELPGWLYNFPQDSATRLSVSQIVNLAKIPTVVGVKQSTDSLPEFLETIAAVGDELRVFGHMLSRLGASLILGGYGGDGHFGSGMLLGSRQPDFFNHLQAGRVAEALEIADAVHTLNDTLRGSEDDYNWRYGGMQASLKAAMNILGQPGGYPRKPKLPVEDDASLDAIRQALVEAGALTHEPAA
ncbi:4-hydroxy-tetrahydrodipicolinate synthase [Arthrobacter sp. V4I6]|uniref:dihydrodipicolinate synthase family protein n=1 Tax=unclassified Arthrobacter TaxID=235627 RepID=UPI002783EE49|nr:MULTISPECIES: dihydrodipicolinate synthase family protein [unclassified Arthrobacter]MDQ0822989.1 4-hydroxy-tetrahydrodipicolinate synthase [Arthrobacter sp. V1I7]MDQ0852617.1 4-hydroxy-tetrahydrodipicolinate synthase [Arthrobacter sp. V4I6]